MNRRDTIIIAVLLNAGLLAILFVMAINNDDFGLTDSSSAPAIVDVTEQSMTPSQEVITLSSPTLPQASPQIGDEIDNALKQYANNPQLILVEDESEPSEKEPAEPPPPPVTTTPPQNPEPPPSTHAPQFVEITVKKGDALEKIARANNTTVDAIKKANNLNNNKLNIGQTLKVPVDSKKSTTNPTPAKTTKETVKIASAEPEFYTIKKGDNPWKIAKQFHVKFDDLLKLNNLDEEKARNLKVGDKIRVK